MQRNIPNQKKAAWVDLGKALHLDTEAIDLILQLREGEKLALKMDPDIIFEKYLVLIEKIIEFLSSE